MGLDCIIAISTFNSSISCWDSIKGTDFLLGSYIFWKLYITVSKRVSHFVSITIVRGSTACFLFASWNGRFKSKMGNTLKVIDGAGCSAWLLTIADWNCREAVCVINWFCIRQILALFKKCWYFDFFLSGEKVRNERSQR